MAAYTTNGTDTNWSTTTAWTPEAPVGGPGNGDTVVLDHNIDIDQDVTIGTSPAQGNLVVTFNDGVTLTLKTVNTLTLRGDMGGTAAVGMWGAFIAEPGSHIIFDSSQATDPTNQSYKIDTASLTNDGITIAINGTSGSRCSVSSNPSGGNGYIYTTGSMTGSVTGTDTITYCDFTDIGSASNPSVRLMGDWKDIIIRHCTFTNCGAITGRNPQETNTDCRIEDNVFSGTLSTTCVLDFGTGSPIGTGTRTILRNTFDQICNFENATDFTITGNYFTEPGNTQVATWSQYEDNFMVWRNPASTIQSLRGNTKDSMFFDHSGGGNIHFTNGSGVANADITHDGLVFSSDISGVDDGDGMQSMSTPPTYKAYVLRCIYLGTATGDDGGPLISLQGDANSDIIIEHNTAYRRVIRAGESYAGHTGMIESLKSNIMYSPEAGSGNWLIRDSQGVTLDYIAAADGDYNATHNATTGSNGVGYDNLNLSSGPIGANDIVADPQFVDAGRSVPHFDNASDGLNNPDGPSWAHGQLYTVGTVVSHSVTDIWGTATINYRCITEHTSNDQDATDFNAPYECTNWRDNWEFQTLYRLREDVSRVPTMIAWIKAAYVPLNSALKGTAHDGGDIGAMPVGSAVITSTVTATNAAGSDQETFTWTEVPPP